MIIFIEILKFCRETLLDYVNFQGCWIQDQYLKINCISMGIAKNNQTLRFLKDNNTTHNRMKTSVLGMILMKIFKAPQTVKGY